MKTPVKIAAFAGAWGYGPVTTAAQVAEALGLRAVVYFIGESIAADFARTEARGFAGVHSREWFVEHADEFAGVISVVEPYGPLFGRALNVPVIAFDNLYWHWEWTEDTAAHVRALLPDRYGPGDVPQLVEDLADVQAYGSYAVMYLTGATVVWQRVAAEPESLPSWMRGQVTFVEPLVDKRFAVPRKQREGVIVSLSGGLVNPYAEPSQWDVYLDVLDRILGDALTSQVVTWAAPIELHSRVVERWQDATPRVYSQDKFLSLLASSEACLAPAGLGTTFEAAACATPLITLPEQHDGNWANYAGIASASNSSYQELSVVFPNAMLAFTEKNLRNSDSEQIFSRLSAAMVDQEHGFISTASITISKALQLAEDDRVGMAGEQIAMIQSFAGNFDGIKQSVLICARKFRLT